MALAQSQRVLNDARALFPDRTFELSVVRTTGDHLQTASLANPDQSLPKGLFTKELETDLLSGAADLAVHSLKDLPTGLPDGLILGAVGPRADVRDVLVYREGTGDPAPAPSGDWTPGEVPVRGYPSGLRPSRLPQGAIVATSSTRRAALLQAGRPDLQVIPIRGNVGTRLRKLAEVGPFDATILAAAGLVRLGMFIGPRGRLMLDPTLRPGHECVPPPPGLLATVLEPEELLPAVGQGAVGLEIRGDDPVAAEVAAALNHVNTWWSVTAERAFLEAMGGGCQSPVAGMARVLGHQVQLEVAAVLDGQVRRASGRRPVREAAALGQDLAREILGAASVG